MKATKYIVSVREMVWRALLMMSCLALCGCGEESVHSGTDVPAAVANDVQTAPEPDTTGVIPPQQDVTQAQPPKDISEQVDDVGPTFDDPPVGYTWFIDLNEGTWQRPDNIDKLTAALGDTAKIYVGIHARTETTADLIMSVGTGEKQDFCSRTIIMDGVALLDDRLFRFGPRDFTIANGTLTQDLMIQGRFSSDFSKVEEMEMEGVLVMDTVPDDILPLPPNTKPCELLGALTVQCTPCDDGSEECLDMRIVGMGGVLVDGLSLEEIFVADCNPGCDASEENPECDTSKW